MNLLILKGFNNYFNRKIKKYANIADYISNSALSYTFSNINFDPNDGVATAQIVGSENQLEADSKTLKWEFEGTPDYVVCYESEFIHNEDETVTEIKHIRSRWFILECVRTREGQYKLALKRDVIADHLEQILTNPCFVEKGYVAPNDPLIFNDEGVSLNQIKNYKGNNPEGMLKDATGVPWIVMYMAQNFPSADMDGMTGTAPNKYLTVTGKTILDTSQAISYSDLPWAGIEPGTNLATNKKIRRIPGAGQIIVSPIIAIRQYWFGFPERPFAYPVRVDLKYNYDYNNSDWIAGYPYLEGQSDEIIKKIGKTTNTTEDNGEKIPFLVRKDIGVTPANSELWYNTNNGGIIDAYGKTNSGVISPNQGKKLRSDIHLVAQKIALHASLKSHTNTMPNILAIKSYLSTKKASFDSNTSHSAVPGTTNMDAYVGGPQTFKSANTLLWYNNKLVTYDNINYYQIKVTRQNLYSRAIDHFTSTDNIIGTSGTNNLAQYLIPDGLLAQTNTNITRNTANTMVETRLAHWWFDIQYIPVTTETIRCRIMQPESSDRIHANDVAYDIIALPYGEINFKIKEGTTTYDKTTSAQASIGIARAIAAASGTALYDMQLLPYCPYLEAAAEYRDNGYIDITGAPNQTLLSGCWFKASKIDSDAEEPVNSKAVTFGLWCNRSHGTFDIAHAIELPEETSEAYKVFNACKKFRLVSPNYSSSFEFNPLKNNGVSIFNVDFNYRPFNSYIHIAPPFDGLYGVDTNDNRGLILQGDFSVGYYSDKWADYQINNANYNEIFNRQIQNIDFNQRQEREKFRVDRTTEGITEVLGLGGGLQGAKAFSGLGPWGMLGGGIGGTVGGMVAHGVGTYYDKKWMEESMAEERSYAIDNFNYALGNVKALPYGLAKSDALTENFKFFPFIEVYDCTDREVELFKAKLLYDGMTVGAIGELQSYIPPEDSGWSFQLLKGRMIMQDGLIDDFQVANAIYTEVNKGFYYVNQYIPPVEEDSD